MTAPSLPPQAGWYPDPTTPALEDRRRNSGVWVKRAAASEMRALFEVAVAEYRGERAALVARLESEAW